MHLRAATHLLKHKRYIQKKLHKFSTGYAQKYTHLVLKNHSMIVKTSLMVIN